MVVGELEEGDNERSREDCTLSAVERSLELAWNGSLNAMPYQLANRGVAMDAGMSMLVHHLN